MPSLTLSDPGGSESQEANEGALTVSRKTAGHDGDQQRAAKP